MTPLYISIALAGICVVSFITLTVIMVSRLHALGEKINYVFIKLYFPVYVHRYNKMILEETGRSSPLFNAWLITINGSWIFAILALILK